MLRSDGFRVQISGCEPAPKVLEFSIWCRVWNLISRAQGIEAHNIRELRASRKAGLGNLCTAGLHQWVLNTWVDREKKFLAGASLQGLGFRRAVCEVLSYEPHKETDGP